MYVYQSVGTQEIHFGRKTDEIAKFSILDEKQHSQFWTKNGQLIGVITEKSCQILSHSFAFIGIYRNAFTVGLKERMPRIIGMRVD